jgi:tyrosine-protein kinase Etk/Wzc
MDEPVSKAGIGDDEVNLMDYLLVIAKYSRMIIFTTMAMGVLTFLILFISPNQYTARARLMPPQQNMTLSAQILDSLSVGSSPGGGGMGGMGSGMASLLGLKSPGDLYVGILKGNTISDRMIKRFDLRDYYKSSLTSKSPPIEDLRETLGENSDMSAGKDNLVEIEVTDKDPKIASEMANAFGEELDKLLREISEKDARNQLAFLEAERTQTSINLAKAEESLRTFSEKTNVIQIDAQTKGMIEYIANLRATIDSKEVQVKVLQQQATSNNFDLVRMETEVEGLKDKLQAAETQMDQKCIGDVCISTNKMPALGLEYLRLYREAKYQEIIYQMYSKLVELARLDVARNVTTVLFVDRAEPPEKKSKPKRLLFTILVTMVTFFFMIFAAFTKEYWAILAQSEGGSFRFRQLHAYLTFWRQDAQHLISWLKRKKYSSNNISGN